MTAMQGPDRDAAGNGGPTRDRAARLLETGEARFQDGDIETARKCFGEAAALEPTWARTWNDLGAARFALGDPEAARAGFLAALDQDPGQVDALANLAGACLALEDLDAGAEALVRLEAAAPGEPAAAELRDALAAALQPVLPPWWELVVHRLLPRGGRILVVGPWRPAWRFAAAPVQLGEHFAEPADAVLLTGSGDLACALERTAPGAPVVRVLAPGEAPADPGACGLASRAAFAPRSGGGWLPAEWAGTEPPAVEVWTLHPWRDPLQGAPKVLMADPDPEDGAFHGRVRAALRDLGVVVAEAWPGVLEVLARHSGQDPDPPAQALGTLLGAVRPAALLAEAGTESGTRVAGCARQRGIPVVTVGSGGRVHPGRERELHADLVQALSTLPHPGTEPSRAPDPLMSLVVPTYDRHGCVVQLLQALTAQDLDPGLFEVIVVDDGSPVPVTAALEGTTWPFTLRLLSQENGGPGKARNTAVRHARGTWLLIFNDDALPAPDNVRRHLVAQAGAPGPRAVLGSFDFDEEACRDPFTDLMQHSTHLFEYALMRPGRLHGWRFFYTCNLSLPRDAFERAGGFDEAFFRAITEDVELGYRLERSLGLKVLYDPRIRAWHDHDMDLERLRRRAFWLGWFQVRMMEKHPELQEVFLGPGKHLGLERELGFRRAHEERLAGAEEATSEVGDLCERMRGMDRLGVKYAALRAHMDRRTREVTLTELARGYVCGMRRWRPEDLHPHRRLLDQTTSVIIPNLNGFPHLPAAIESLRRHTRGPWEAVVVDNGSTDGSLEWLREQEDIRLIELGANAGAPAARNRALRVARGATILFCDNDVVFTPGWREILLGHLESWPDVGVVGPMSDYVSGIQKAADRPASGEDLEAFARRFHREHAGEHTYSSRLILFFMLCRRELIEHIGGIDERYGRWGFEDDDFALRALLAGYQLRVARDCFIRHLGSQTARTADLDYARLLRENWEVFKRKWDLDPGLPYGRFPPLKELLDRPYSREELYVSYAG